MIWNRIYSWEHFRFGDESSAWQADSSSDFKTPWSWSTTIICTGTARNQSNTYSGQSWLFHLNQTSTQKRTWYFQDMNHNFVQDWEQLSESKFFRRGCRWSRVLLQGRSWSVRTKCRSWSHRTDFDSRVLIYLLWTKNTWSFWSNLNFKIIRRQGKLSLKRTWCLFSSSFSNKTLVNL